MTTVSQIATRSTLFQKAVVGLSIANVVVLTGFAVHHMPAAWEQAQAQLAAGELMSPSDITRTAMMLCLLSVSISLFALGRSKRGPVSEIRDGVKKS